VVPAGSGAEPGCPAADNPAQAGRSSRWRLAHHSPFGKEPSSPIMLNSFHARHFERDYHQAFDGHFKSEEEDDEMLAISHCDYLRFAGSSRFTVLV
jgi:hypothetical protein